MESMREVISVQPLYRSKKRAWELDFLRGIAVIAMMCDHLMWDFFYARNMWFSNFAEVDNPFINACYSFAVLYLNSTETYGFRFFAHILLIFAFLFTVGVSCAFSRDNAMRGTKLVAFAILLTGISYGLKYFGIFNYGVVSGILHCIAMCVLCVAALDNLTRKNIWLNTYLPLMLGFFILAVSCIYKHWETPFDTAFDSAHFLGYIMGTRGYGDDWFGLFPWLGMVLLGVYWGKAMYTGKRSLLPSLDGKWNAPVNFLGRYALVAYFVHQVAVAGLVMALCLCLGYRF